MSVFPFGLAYAVGSAAISLKQSSHDITGGNNDFKDLAPGSAWDVFSCDGPGAITHICLTIGDGDPNVLKDMVLRAYWDGNERPSVEVPIGDFFGLNLNEYFIYQSAFLNCSPVQALNCYFAMPFPKHARISITHEGRPWVPSPSKSGRMASPTNRLYWNIDYTLGNLPPDALYFHAQYRQAAPNRAVTLAALNTDGAQNYVFVETEGQGHLMGVTLGVVQSTPGWFGEGDDMTFIDEPMPTIIGTGTEDYFNGAWDFGFSSPQPFANLYHGAPFTEAFPVVGSKYVMYRWHADNPITFRQYLKHTIEHGDQNGRGDFFYSVCYWYQSGPYTAFPQLPAAADRIPPVFLPLNIRESSVDPNKFTK